ncbi:MAG: hypothetical protein OEU52_10815, partial [Xanthomonadales bacterium]|nr:hypothetical protein [Xanthomonadales bacterium]
EQPASERKDKCSLYTDQSNKEVTQMINTNTNIIAACAAQFSSTRHPQHRCLLVEGSGTG